MSDPTGRKSFERMYRTRRPILGGQPRRDGNSAQRCPDCGEPGEQLGHMGCQYPGLRSERRS